jgi:hypothetical protein
MALVVDSQEASGAAHHANAGTLSWSFTNTAGDILIVGAISTNATQASSSISSVTYGGQALTFIDGYTTDQNFHTQLGLYYLLSPPTGSNTVTVTIASSAGAPDILGGAIALKGANQSTPIGVHGKHEDNSSNITDEQVTLAGTTAGSIVLAVCATGTSITSADSPSTQSYKLNVSSNTSGDNIGGSYYATPGGSVTMGFTVASDFGHIVAAEIKAAPAGASDPFPLAYDIPLLALNQNACYRMRAPGDLVQPALILGA